jgi:hypothetical protein
LLRVSTGATDDRQPGAKFSGRTFEQRALFGVETHRHHGETASGSRSTLHRLRTRIRQLLPDARGEIGHGFCGQREYDVVYRGCLVRQRQTSQYLIDGSLNRGVTYSPPAKLLLDTRYQCVPITRRQLHP